VKVKRDDSDEYLNKNVNYHKKDHATSGTVNFVFFNLYCITDDTVGLCGQQ